MILYDFLNSDGVQKVLNMLDTILEIIRWVVPIGLIIMTSIDVFKKVIDPNEKEGQKKIVQRLAAAIIVFLIPTIINLLMYIIEKGK